MPLRTVLIVLAFAFAATQVARGAMWSDVPEYPWMLGAVLAGYALGIGVCILTPMRRPRDSPGEPGHRMPAWVAALGASMAATVPTLTEIAVGEGEVPEPAYTTWYIGAVGALSVVMVVRRRPVWAWVSFTMLAVATIAWLGWVPALELGLVGSLVWLAVAHLMVVMLARAASDAERLERLQATASAWEGAQAGREHERRVQLDRARAVGEPMLRRVVETGGALTDGDRREAAIAEAQLRDEIRGAALLDDDVRIEIAAARRRGAHVSVFDDGGLEHLETDELARVRAEVAAAVRDAASTRIIVRSSPHERVVATVVGRELHGDDVDLWREIEATGPA